MASVDTILRDTVPAHSSPAVCGLLGDEGGYGFGWVHTHLDGEDVFFHTGKVPGSTSAFALVPGRRLRLVLLADGGDFLVGTPLVEDLVDALVRRLLGHPVPLPTAGQRRARRAVVNGACLGLLGLSALTWRRPTGTPVRR